LLFFGLVKSKLTGQPLFEGTMRVALAAAFTIGTLIE